jgi:hypothetical protein
MTIIADTKIPTVENDVHESVMLATLALEVCGKPKLFILPAHIVKHTCK